MSNRENGLVSLTNQSGDTQLTSLLEKALPAVNGALRNTRLLVLTPSLALGSSAVESWRGLGLAACAVVGEKCVASQLLPSILASKVLPEVVLALQHASGKSLLPSDGRVALSLNRLPALAGHRRAHAHGLLELTTLSPRLRHQHQRSEPVPLFAVPSTALSLSHLSEIARNSFSPVLVFELGAELNPEHIAEVVLRVQPRGPWALFGDVHVAPELSRAARLVESRAGRAEWNEVVQLALMQGRDHYDVSVAHEGHLHLIRCYSGATVKSIMLSEQKSQHYVVNEKNIATVINEFLLSSLTKIVTC